MMNEDILARAGVDYAKGVRRYLDDAEIYEMLLLDFCGDSQLKRSEEAFESKDQKMLLEAAHEVKGTAANLDMTRLYAAASELVCALRGENGGDVEALYRSYIETFRETKAAVTSARE